MKGGAMLWAGVSISPIVWFANLELNFALAPLVCSGNGRGMLVISSIAALALVVAAGLLSWTQLGQPQARRVVAFGGIVLSGLFFLVILAQVIPTLMMRDCG